MKYHLFITLFCIFPLLSFAQRDLDSTEVARDFQIFENILYQGHPALYEYIEKDSLDQVMRVCKDSLAAQQLSDIDLFKKMTSITDRIKDGHLMLFAPNTIKTDQYYFPLILKIIKKEFYTDTDDFDIPIGSKITKINGKKTNQILDELKKYTPTDGYNVTRKYRDIELKFGLFYTYEYGIQKKFDIEYTTPDGISETIQLEAESFAKVKLRNTKRKSYFAAYHQQPDGIKFFDQYIGKKEPFIHYKPESNTAILVVNSFRIDVRSFQSKLNKIFEQIKNRKVKNLIVDIRQNEGGYRPNAIKLYSFLTNKPFRQRTSEFIASLSIPERAYAKRITLEEEKYLKAKFFNHPQIDGWKVDYDDMQTIMVPDKNRFKGAIYVLVSGTTFSEASSFALNAKNNPKILLVGEETGGGYYFHSGDFIVYYELPNSKIMMLMPTTKVNHYAALDLIPKGSGVPPDRHIPLSKKNLLEGKDAQLDYVLKLVSPKKNP